VTKVIGCVVLATAIAACRSNAGTSDAAPRPPTLYEAMVAGGPVVEDFVWKPTNYTPCTGCEHLISYDLSDDKIRVHVFERTPGDVGSITPRCTFDETLTEDPVDGFDPAQRALLHLTVQPGNTCGFDAATLDYVLEVVTRDADEAPTYVAAWPAGADPAGPFPGYDYLGGGQLATPTRLCPTAPDTLCEPACNLNADTSACDLPEP
jgi:hypothetical protein